MVNARSHVGQTCFFFGAGAGGLLGVLLAAEVGAAAILGAEGGGGGELGVTTVVWEGWEGRMER